MFENYQIFLKINTDLLSNTKFVKYNNKTPQELIKTDDKTIIKKTINSVNPWHNISTESLKNEKNIKYEGDYCKTQTFDSFLNLEQHYSQPFSLQSFEIQKKIDENNNLPFSKHVYLPKENKEILKSEPYNSNSSQLFKDYFFKNSLKK